MTQAIAPEVIYARGQIAELRKARKRHLCRFCSKGIEIGEPHFVVTIGGGGLGSIKHPDCVHEVCLDSFL